MKKAKDIFTRNITMSHKLGGVLIFLIIVIGSHFLFFHFEGAFIKWMMIAVGLLSLVGYFAVDMLYKEKVSKEYVRTSLMKKEDYFTKEYFEIFKVRLKKLVVILLVLSGLWFWLDYFNLLS